MSTLRVERGLEYGTLMVYDAGIQEDLPEFDLYAERCFIHGSSVIIAAQDESDGDTTIQLWIDEPDSSRATLPLLKRGVLNIPTGDLHLYTASWSPDDTLTILPGVYEVLVHANMYDSPTVEVILSRK